MRQQYILALDQGTTSSRALLVDATGAIRSVAQRPFRQIFPRPGWVEHDPREIWSSQIGVAAEVLAHAGVEPGEIAGIGIANQRETAVVWDRRTGEPVQNAIVWQDRRTAEICDGLRREGLAERIQEKTGLLPDAYFSGSKVRWVLDHVPGARARAERGELLFGTVDSWLLWKMTEGERHVTDVTNASRTMLWNLETQDWDDELLEWVGVPRAMLPEVVSSSGVAAEAKLALAGGGAGLPVAGIAGDQQAALFGQMCTRPGMVKCTFGTGSFMLMNTGAQPIRSKHQLLTTMGWRLGGARAEFALEGSMLMAGAVVQWLRDGLEIIRSAAEVEALASSVPDAGGVVLVPAFAGLGAPHWDQAARGALVGMTRGTTKAHIARAALESIALQVVDVLEAMQADVLANGAADEGAEGAPLVMGELRVDGGAAANDMLMQLQADLLGVRVVRPKNTEATAMGAAYLAGLGVGLWRETAELERSWAVDRVFEPKMKASEREAMRDRWLRALGRAGGWESR